MGAARKQEQMPFFNLQHAIELRLQRDNDDRQHFCELGHGCNRDRGMALVMALSEKKKMAMCSNILRPEKGDEGQNLMGVVSGTKSAR